MMSAYTDLREDWDVLPDYQSCPPGDQQRNDERLQCLYKTAQLLRVSYPTCTIRFFINGQRLSGRYHEIKDLEGTRQLAEFGDVEYGEEAWQKASTTLDSLSRFKAVADFQSVQPQPFGSTAGNTGSWSEVMENSDKSWYIKPTYVPASSISVKPQLKPTHGTAIRLIIDANILQRRDKVLLKLVGMFQGDIQMTSLPEVVKEMSRGKDAFRRMAAHAKIMSLKKSTTVTSKSVEASSRPMDFGVDTPPKLGPHLFADLGITVQLGKVITELERNSTAKKVVVLFITQVSGCSQLARSVKAKEAVYIPLLVEAGEIGNDFMDVVFNQLMPHLE